MMALHIPSFGLAKAWLTLAGSLLTLAVASSLPVPAWAQAGANGSLRDTSSRCGGDVNAVQSGTASSLSAIADFGGALCQMHAGGFGYLGVVGAGAHVSSQIGGVGSVAQSAGASGSWTDGLDVVWSDRFSVSDLGRLRLNFNVGAHGGVSASKTEASPFFAIGSADIGYSFNFAGVGFGGTQRVTGGEALTSTGTWGTIAGSVDLAPTSGSGGAYGFSGISLALSGSAGALVQTTSFISGRATTADADFGSTLQWMGVVGAQAFDTAGNEITLPADFQVGLVGRQTGFDYWNEAPLAAVPEPATCFLFTAGLAGLAALGRRRRP